MSSPVVWQADGTPRSSRFDDSYRSGQDDLAQARGVFLRGCGLLQLDPSDPAPAWRGAEQWHVLETGFGLGLNFLATWLAWRNDPQRPARLFFSSAEAWPVQAEDLLRSAGPFPELQPLAKALATQWRGLLPGVHRFVLDGGQVQLTLGVAQAQDWLPTLDTPVNSVYLDGFSPAVNADIWDTPILKAVARLCRPGSRLATWNVAQTVRDGLTQLGFSVERAAGLSPERDRLQATHAPHWPIKTVLRSPASTAERHVVVVGAGLAGSAVAYSLARRGWRVDVLDQAEAPAAGASGLPTGIVAPHISPDDSVLSRLSRAGVRTTLQRAAEQLKQGTEWDLSGTLEHRIEGKRGLPDSALWREPDGPGWAWSHEATTDQRLAAGLPAEVPAVWHALAGWLRPAALVQAQLRQPNIHWQGGAQVARLQRQDGLWQMLDGDGRTLAQAPHVVLATAHPTLALLRDLWPHLPLNALRGQITWDWLDHLPPGLRQQLPPYPVNGYGNWVAGTALRDGVEQACWILGSTFERGATEPVVKPDDQDANWERLARLLPGLASALQPHWPQAQAWAAVRCTLPDRLPAVGPVDETALPGLMVCTGMGARGLTLSVLCGEWLAARIHGEPWPMERKLAQALAASRFGAATGKG